MGLSRSGQSQDMELTWAGTPPPPQPTGLSCSGPSQDMGFPGQVPLQPMGLSWSGPSQDTELPLQVPWQGWEHRNRAYRPHCRALPAHLSLRSDTEHLRAGLELTNSSSDRSVTLGITLCGLPPPGLPETSTAPGAPGLCLHPPPTPPLPDSWVPLIRRGFS